MARDPTGLDQFTATHARGEMMAFPMMTGVKRDGSSENVFVEIA